MISSANKHLDFNAFLLNLAPIVIIIITVTALMIYLIYHKQLKADPIQIQKLMNLNEANYIKDRVLMRKSLIILGACLGGNGTLIGASANVIVAGIASREGHGFSYMSFLKFGLPITIESLLISHAYIYLRYLM
jgi:Na+/H+ antiporter NhaD/arsenite permease-like protein